MYIGTCNIIIPEDLVLACGHHQLATAVHVHVVYGSLAHYVVGALEDRLWTLRQYIIITSGLTIKTGLGLTPLYTPIPTLKHKVV